MSDLIRREDAINLFKNCYAGLSMSADEAYRKILFTLRTLPSTDQELKWIPVTERLPMNGVDVIVSVLDDSGDTPYRFTSVGWCTPNGQYWVVDNEMCYGVIAWQPLPEPYRGE